MKKIIFILCTVLTTSSFAKSDIESITESCKLLGALAEATQVLRQRGMNASDVADKIFEVTSNYNKQQIDETLDKEKIEKSKEFAIRYKESLDSYTLVIVQEAFLVPIQSNKDLKKKVIDEFANEHYLSCLLQISENNQVKK